ncbi:MAG: DUF2723 domain-containing protein [Oligoflexia bacterium]|nr:DUF2723 domain-containing protein [Oligoflexia bacterium]
MKKKHRKQYQMQNPVATAPVKIPYELPRRTIHLDALALTLIIFIYYLCALAPSVTFEDSGEFIAAIASMGVPHPPGYPLLMLFGKLFQTLIPFGTIAFRINLFSALCSALAIGLFCLTAHLWIKYFYTLFANIDIKIIRLLVVISAFFIGTLPDYLSQALITEVYGLNNLHCGVMIYILSWWVMDKQNSEKSKERVFYFYAFLSGLCFSNHHTTSAFVFFGPLWILLFDSSFVFEHGRPKLKRLFLYACFLLLSLLPLLYLPLAASQQPLLNWGDPSTWSRFWDVFTRQQYSALIESRPFEKYVMQIYFQMKVLFENYRILPVFLGYFGLYFLYLKNRRLCYCSLLLLFITGILSIWIFNPDSLNKNLFSRYRDEEMVRVFFLIHYYYLGLLTIIGTLHFLQNKAKAFRQLFIYASLAFTLLNSAYIFYRGNLHSYHYPEQLFNNILKLTKSKPSIIFTNTDPFSFSFLYFTVAEKRGTQNYFIDIEMLRGSWYVKQMQQWYPEIMKKSEKEVQQYYKAIVEFEESNKADLAVLEKLYYGMLNSIIDHNINEIPVYFAVYPYLRPIERKLATNYKVISCLVAYCVLPNNGASPPVLDEYDFDFSGLAEDDRMPDRMAERIASYYAFLFWEKAGEANATSPLKAAQLLERTRSFFIEPLLKERFPDLKRPAI